jgi:GTPase Era involved in 16S rRNA processing
MSVKFAVVGHPNKGKSTIVSNLAMDDSIAISNIPGTTTKSKEYTLKVNGEDVYTLIDTPGFQRPRQVLAYLESKNAPAHKRLEVVKEFIKEFEDNPKFQDDIELLKPLVEGAGVLYVVDASKPYTPEYENDMRILSYLGAPSMAILNFIDDADYSEEWKNVLKHYFKLIKRFNPMVADINAYIDLLEAISHLNEEWKEPIKESIWAFEELFKQRVASSSEIITQNIFKIASYKKKAPFSEDKTLQQKLVKSFQEDIKKFEKESFKNILKVWEHKNVHIDTAEVALDKIDLFSKEAIDFFGLSQKDFVLYAGLAGAIAGAGIDLTLLGHTAFIGAGIGALLGGVGGYLGYEKALDVKVKGFSIAKKYLEVGPIEDINFYFVLLQRALFYTKSVATLSYAKRGDIKLELQNSELLTSNEKKKFFKLHKALINDKNKESKKLEYQKFLEEVITRLIKEGSA